MDKQFIASEVREMACEARWQYKQQCGYMLNAYADLLEAQEKAVPVATLNATDNYGRGGMTMELRPNEALDLRMAKAIAAVLRDSKFPRDVLLHIQFVAKIQSDGQVQVSEMLAVVSPPAGQRKE